MSPAETAELIKTQFGLTTLVGPRNRVRVLMDVAVTTNFWLSICYSFGCVIVSDTLFDSRGGF